MAEKLVKYYKYVGDEKSMDAKFELAARTKVPSVVAATKPDSPALIALFKREVRSITGKEAPDF